MNPSIKEFLSHHTELFTEYGKLIFSAHLLEQNLFKIRADIALLEEKLIKQYETNDDDLGSGGDTHE